MPFEVDVNYFKVNFKGNTYGQSDDILESNLNKSIDVIHSLTYDRLRSGKKDFDKLPAYRQEDLKKATCFIAQDLLRLGGYELAYSGEQINSISLGRFSYSTSGVNSGSGKSFGGYKIPDIAYDLVLRTGLMYSGVDTFTGDDFL